MERAEPRIFELNGDRASEKARFRGAIWPAHLVPGEEPGRILLGHFQWDRERHRKGIVLLRLRLGA